MESKLYTFNEVVAFIKQGFLLSLAADERVLKNLPPGNWIGGTIPYFMDVDTGKFDQELIFVNIIDVKNCNYEISVYDEETITDIIEDTYQNGYTILILPPFQKIHENYAIQVEDLNGLYNNPIVGWIAGSDLNSDDVPKTYCGVLSEEYVNKGVAIHVELPENKIAQVDIVNIFEQDNNDDIKFYSNSFEVTNCMINGEDANLANYITNKNINTKLPLIADYFGASINVSIKEINLEKGTVSFFAPIFKSKTYRFPKDILDYIKHFDRQTQDLPENNVFSCNCILNYLYGEMEGKKINNVKGPITFGEIAYQLLNQTLVYLTISEI